MNNHFLRVAAGVVGILLSATLLLLRPEINQVFIWQLAGMVFMAGVYLVWKEQISKYANAAVLFFIAGIAILHSIPSFGTYPLFVLPVLLLLVASYSFLRIAGRSSLASLFGACIFTCSSWLPLFFITGGANSEMLSIRDALIDPNQISVSHGSGGYVGVPGVLFAIAGLLIVLAMVIRKRFTPVQAEFLISILLAVSLYIAFVQSPIANPRAIIVVVACIAFLASLAFDRMQRFLGLRDTLIQTVMAILFSIALLDLMHISAQTFAYGLGI